jgi:N utilization substance protein B
MQTIFESEYRLVDRELSLEKNIEDIGEDSLDGEFSRELVQGVLVQKDAICAALEKYAPEWPLSRMDTLTRSILLLAGYELLHSSDTPPAVIMNEAIEIAKEFGPEESPKFVNGVLNAFAKAIRSPQVV